MLSLIDTPAQPTTAQPFNLAANVLARAPDQPHKTALQLLYPDRSESWSFRELEAAVRGCGTGLLALGLKPGDRILMRLGNSVDFPVLFLGAIAAGLIPVPTSSQLTGPEVNRLCQTIQPSLIVAGPGVTLPDPVPCPVIPSGSIGPMAALPPVDYALGDANRLAYIVFTSGTSGKQQAVTHAHRAILARQMMMQDWYGLTPQDRLMHAGAFNWTYTLGTGLMDPWTIGATALIPAAGTLPEALPALLRDHDATIFAAAPGVYRQMLRTPFPPLPKLRHGLSAGEALAASIRAEWTRQTGTDIHEAFGMSEVSTFISASPNRPAPPGTSGFAQTGRRIAVLDDAGFPVPRGTPGILAVSRDDPGLFLGYYNDPKATQARFKGNWYLTGDTVEMRADGAIRYLGRHDDMMNAGGYRVSPLEVEAALSTHPDLTECAVVEHEVKPGTSLIACAYVAPTPLDSTVLSAFAAQILARYKQPRLYHHVTSLPHNANGKINRRALREILAKASPSTPR